MEKNWKYVIAEKNGNFQILIKRKEVEGCLWWKKEVEKTYITNWRGCTLSFNYKDTPSPYFNSLRAAKEQIKTWLSETIYHEVE